MFIIYGTCNHISWYLSSLTKDKDYIVYKKGLDLKSLPISHCVIASDPTKYLTLRNEFLKIYEISGCDGTLNIVHSYFDNFDLFNSLHKSFSHESLILNAYDFEKCAAEIIRLMDKNVISLDLTRFWVDGGRDGLGKYSIGSSENSIEVDFAMEAKRYKDNQGVRVRWTSRLISRIRHRQFGVLVTTSYVHHQAYKEITKDGHPLIIVSAIDIVKILKQNGITDLSKLKRWLKQF